MAFEPGKNAYARLTENLALNPWRNIQAYPLAVTDREGEAVLHLAGDIADSSANLYQAAQARADQRGLPDGIPGPLSCGQENLPHPISSSWMPRGRSWPCCKGLKSSSMTHPPVADGNGRKNLQAAGASKAAVAQFLTGCGYRAAHLSKGRWYATADPAGVKGRNIFWFNSTGCRPTGSKRRACRSSRSSGALPRHCRRTTMDP